MLLVINLASQVSCWLVLTSLCISGQNRHTWIAIATTFQASWQLVFFLQERNSIAMQITLTALLHIHFPHVYCVNAFFCIFGYSITLHYVNRCIHILGTTKIKNQKFITFIHGLSIINIYWYFSWTDSVNSMVNRHNHKQGHLTFLQ